MKTDVLGINRNTCNTANVVRCYGRATTKHENRESEEEKGRRRRTEIGRRKIF